MPVTLYNTLGKQKQPFEPLEAGHIRMYNCGPTVYGRSHIGNLASFLFADFLRRHLDASGFEVRQVKNITDVGHLTQEDFDAGEDKMVAAAKREGKGVEVVAKLYTDLYLADEQALNMLEPAERPRASAYVPQQIAFVEALIASGHAYAVEGNVYFDVTSFSAYGALSGNTVDALQAGARIEVDTHKHHPADFLLWRKAKPDHLMQWPSPWGQGYPGWHIECSAMAKELLGEQIDIHTGGEDNIFPHHESEIAQTESLSGQPFARVWMHRRHILVDGQKMAKSKGNFYTLDDVRAQGFDPLDFRFLVFSSHYRSKLDFSWDAMRQAQEGVARLRAFSERVKEATAGKTGNAHDHLLTQHAWERLQAAFDDDLNTPEALAVVFELVRAGNALLDQLEKTPDDSHASFAPAAMDVLVRFDRVLGVLGSPSSPAGAADEATTIRVKTLIQERETARAAKDFTRADAIRDELTGMGILLEDTPTGARWKPAPKSNS